MRSSYKKEDVEILLKDITGLVVPQTTEEREKLIQSGRHYSEMLPIEYSPSEKYIEAYYNALENYGKSVANAVGVLSDKIYNKKGSEVILVSLARAGIPAGILIKRYFKFKYNCDIKHYAISIIRGRGIDKNAIKYIIERHNVKDILFVDGWIGKGAILNELKKCVKDFEGLSSDLAVIADPANITNYCGTNEDILIPSSCLNSTVSGLISRTFLRDDIIGENDFHGAVYYGELKDKDISYEFIENIEKYFKKDNIVHKKLYNSKGIDEVLNIQKKYNVSDINFIKPGIGEATRVLLRRVPWKIIINENNKNDNELNHIKHLAKEKNVNIEYDFIGNYKVCGIIKNMSDI